MIGKLIPILAQQQLPVTPEDLRKAPGGLANLRLNDLFTIIAVTLVLVVLLILWALFIRKPPSDSGRTRVYKSHHYEEELEDGRIRKRKKHKRQRREHRSRNPTLAEVGGLPPVKPDNTPPPI